MHTKRKEMNMARVKKLKKVLFQFNSEPGRQVFLAGSFNDWNPTRTPLAAAAETGLYTVSLDLPKGRHEYQARCGRRMACGPDGHRLRAERTRIDEQRYHRVRRKGAAMRHDTRTSGPLRVLLVDDHKMLLDALSSVLRREGFSIVDEAGTGEDAVCAARSCQPDIVLMDVRMPGMGGVRATAALLKVSPRSRVVGLSMSSDRDTVLQMMQAGACAFVAKAEQDDLIAVLRRLKTECLSSPDRRGGQGRPAPIMNGLPACIRRRSRT